MLKACAGTSCSSEEDTGRLCFACFQMTIANRERLPIVHWFAGISIAALENTTAIYSFHNTTINGEDVGSSQLWPQNPGICETCYPPSDGLT